MYIWFFVLDSLYLYMNIKKDQIFVYCVFHLNKILVFVFDQIQTQLLVIVLISIFWIKLSTSPPEALFTNINQL